jgi:hypothetical protein
MVYVPLPSLTLTFINKAALPFSGIDILYGRWASGLVNPNPDGSPPSAAAIRAISDQSAYIGVGITFGMWATTGGFFYCSEYSCHSPFDLPARPDILCSIRPVSLASSRVVARMRRAYLAAILAQDATCALTLLICYLDPR